MVLHSGGCGRVGHRRTIITGSGPARLRGLNCFNTTVLRAAYRGRSGDCLLGRGTCLRYGWLARAKRQGSGPRPACGRHGVSQSLWLLAPSGTTPGTTRHEGWEPPQCGTSGATPVTTGGNHRRNRVPSETPVTRAGNHRRNMTPRNPTCHDDWEDKWSQTVVLRGCVALTLSPRAAEPGPHPARRGCKAQYATKTPALARPQPGPSLAPA